MAHLADEFPTPSTNFGFLHIHTQMRNILIDTVVTPGLKANLVSVHQITRRYGIDLFARSIVTVPDTKQKPLSTQATTHLNPSTFANQFTNKSPLCSLNSINVAHTLLKNHFKAGKLQIFNRKVKPIRKCPKIHPPNQDEQPCSRNRHISTSKYDVCPCPDVQSH